MFEQTFKNTDPILHNYAGCSSDLKYVDGTLWVLFLKYLGDLAQDRSTSTVLAGKNHNS